MVRYMSDLVHTHEQKPLTHTLTHTHTHTHSHTQAINYQLNPPIYFNLDRSSIFLFRTQTATWQQAPQLSLFSLSMNPRVETRDPSVSFFSLFLCNSRNSPLFFSLAPRHIYTPTATHTSAIISFASSLSFSIFLSRRTIAAKGANSGRFSGEPLRVFRTGKLRNLFLLL